ncbi:MAG: cell wall hydrolase [Bacteroidota bacterium]
MDFKNDEEVLARTIFGECEPNNDGEAMAIASVVKNRIGKAYWPYTAAAVCLQAWQFSCWNPNDPNRDRIINAKGAWFKECQRIAQAALETSWVDTAEGSTHYYLDTIKTPKWANGKRPVKKIAHRNKSNHLFFNNIDTKPPQSVSEALEQIKPIKESRTVKGTAVAASATLLGTCGEAISQLQPAMPLLQTIAQYAPYVFGILTLAALVYVLVARYDDRKKGLR